MMFMTLLLLLCASPVGGAPRETSAGPSQPEEVRDSGSESLSVSRNDFRSTSSSGRGEGGVRRMPARSLHRLLRPPPATDRETPPSPAEFFGFVPGTDGRLIAWKDLCSYYRLLAETSARVHLRTVGRTTDGRELIEIALSALPPDELEAVRRRQEGIARATMNEEELARIQAEQPVVVYIQGTLHSTEIGASLMFPELVYDLATGLGNRKEDPLRNVVVVLVPSANPDGLDMVVDWYRKTKGTPFEGTGPPRLYQRYAGHDNNRDWFMLSLKETRLISSVLYERWFPSIFLDIHQMGTRGARMFVPPFSDPLNPNIQAMTSRLMDLVGAHMATALAGAGCRGVVQDVVFDNWWHGGARAVPSRHNMVGVLTETASARLASPLWLDRKDLRGHGRGFPDHKRRGAFPDPWPGGWWRIGDVVRYQRVAVDALLELASRYRRLFIRQQWRQGREERSKGERIPPYAFILPDDQPDGGALLRLLRNLRATGVEVHRAVKPLVAGGIEHPPGTWVISCAQAFRPHIKDLLEPQHYPELRMERGGDVIRPYDSSGWTLPFLFGLRCLPVEDAPLSTGDLERVEAWPERPARDDRWRGLAPETPVRIPVSSNGAFTLVNHALRRNVPVRLLEKQGEFTFSLPAKPLPELLPLVRDANLDIRPHSSEDGSWKGRLLRSSRVGVLQTLPESMDGGWTLLVLEEHGFEPTRLLAADVRMGNLEKRFDCIILPDVSRRLLEEGAPEGRLPGALRRGLGRLGRAALRRFVARGGRLLAFSRSVPFVIDLLHLPVEWADVSLDAQGRKEGEVSVPGTILRAIPRLHGNREPRMLAMGMPEEVAVYVDRGRVLRRKNGKGVLQETLLRYAATDILLSGHLRGAERLAGESLMASFASGRGRAILYAFRPQHRSQTLGTFRLVFNALLTTGGRPR